MLKLMLRSSVAFLGIATATVAWPQEVALERATGWAQERSDIKPDPSVLFGTLPNGMRYAIQHSDAPNDGIAMRLWLGSGSLQERDDERGLTHFLEHMSFRGTRSIKDGEVVRMLQRNGLQFGTDSNAFTGYDQMYFQYDFPRADAAAISDGLKILREQASFTAIDPKLVEEEKGVLLSEQRVRDTPDGQARDATLDMILQGTRAPDRHIGGTIDALKAASAPKLRRIYESMFRPDNAVLVVVGDIDPAAIERDIKARFSDWKPAMGARDKIMVGAPTSIRKAKELVGPGIPDSVTISWIRPLDRSVSTTKSMEREIREVLATLVLNLRLADRAAMVGSPYVRAQSETSGNLVSVAGHTSISIIGQPEKWASAVDAVIEEQRILLRDGVSKNDLARASGQLQVLLDQSAAGAKTRRAAEIANSFIASINTDQVITSPAQDVELWRPGIASATPDNVQAALRSLFEGKGPIIVRKAKAGAAGEAALEQRLAAAMVRDLPAPKVETVFSWPYSDFGTAGKVVARNEDAKLGTTTVSFANGTRLIIKPTSFEKGSVRVGVALGQGKAGASRDLTRALWATPQFVFGGMGKASLTELSQWAQAQGKAVSIDFQPSSALYALIGNTRPADLTVQLQVLAAYARDPGFRPEMDERVSATGPMSVSQIGGNISASFARARSVALTSGDARFFDLATDADFASATGRDVERLLRPQLQGREDLVIVGDVSVDAAIAAAASTFGAGPKRASVKAVDTKVIMPKGGGQPFTAVHTGRADQAIIGLYWQMPDYFADPKSAETAQIISAVLQQRLTETARAKLGLTYTPMASADAGRVLKGYGYIGAAIETPEANFQVFKALMIDQMKNLATTPISTDELDRARKPIVERRRKQWETNDYWISNLTALTRDPRRKQEMLARQTGLQPITPQDIQKLVQQRIDRKEPITITVTAKAP